MIMLSVALAHKENHQHNQFHLHQQGQHQHPDLHHQQNPLQNLHLQQEQQCENKGTDSSYTSLMHKANILRTLVKLPC